MSKNATTLHSEIDDIDDMLKDIAIDVGKLDSISDPEDEKLTNSCSNIIKSIEILNVIISSKRQNNKTAGKNVSTVKPAGGQAVKSNKERRQHDDGFDLALLAAMGVAKTDLPVSLKHLQKIALAYDSNSNKESTTSKLHRWRENEIAQWRHSNRRTLTKLGQEKMNELVYHVSHENKARISEAIKSVLGVVPTF